MERIKDFVKQICEGIVLLGLLTYGPQTVANCSSDLESGHSMTEETLRLKIKELNTTSDQSYKELLELKARTIEEWQRQGQALPKVYGLSDAIDSFKTDYNSRPQLIFAAKSSYNDIELSFDGISEAHKQSKKIYVVVIKGKRKIFRPFTEDDIATTLAASTLDKLLNTHIAPRYSMAEVNGTPGILGEYIEGTFSPTPVREDLQKWLVQKHGQKKALSAVAEAQVFAFLVENSDLHRDNIKINSQGRIMFFDHGSELSFEPQVLTMNLENCFTPEENDFLFSYNAHPLFGSSLPQKYTRSFIEALKRATPILLKQKLSPFLAQNSIEALIFRRAMILKDAEAKGFY